jgi:bifunctional DNA-binding transcriptional regulator/antitoxin component of YhaV-PrlF toxin-antitoxin module
MEKSYITRRIEGTHLNKTVTIDEDCQVLLPAEIREVLNLCIRAMSFLSNSKE